MLCWLLTGCIVIRACISMAYPPRHARDANSGVDRWVEPPGTEDQEDLMPGGTEEAQRLLAYNLVHFDLDPQNGRFLDTNSRAGVKDISRLTFSHCQVMIGDFDNDQHGEVPIFKVRKSTAAT